MEHDIVGDIHGHADALEALLETLGYEERGGAWRHPYRTMVFLGDFVDRGPDQLRLIDTVRRMLDAGSALAVMGNHEFNAIGYATRSNSPPHLPLRANDERNTRSHRAFLEAVGGDRDLHDELVGWFMELPLWLETDGFRAVHACWHPAEMRALARHVDAGNRLTDAGLHAVYAKGTPAYAAAEIVLKGLEIDLPAGATFEDGDGISRKRTRVAWWREPETYREAVFDAFVSEETLRRLTDEPVPESLRLPYDGEKPVFFGHYWMRGEPFLLGPDRACLDWSVAKDGFLCAYTHRGEPELDPANMTWVRPGPRDGFRPGC